jgi:integrase
MPSLTFKVKTIEALKPPVGIQVDYFDKALRGFILRVSPSGRKTFGVLYRHGGRLRRMSLGTFPPLTLAEARKMASDVLRDATQGKDPATEKARHRDADSFKDLAAEYIERYAKPRKKSWREDKRIIDNKLTPILGNIRAKDIKRADIRNLLEKIAIKAPIEANRVLAAVRKIYNWALSQDLVESNPCLGIPAPGEERRRDRVLTEEEIKILWKDLDNEELPIASTFKVRLLTAQRGGEVFSMEWSELDLVNGWWTIPAEKSKNGLAHRVPLSPPSLSLIEDLKFAATDKKKHSQWVFPAPWGRGHLKNIQKCTERIRERTKLDFRAHDLRRTAASLMTGMGILRLTVSKILNHVEPGVTAVYDRHSYDNEKRQALDAWGRRLMMLISQLRAVENQES